LAAAPPNPFATHQWEAVYLLACRALPRSPALDELGSDLDRTVDFIEFTTADTPIRSGVNWSPKERLDAALHEQVDAFGLRATRVQDFVVLYVFVKLSKAGTEELLAERGLIGTDGKAAGYNRFLNMIIGKLAPEMYPSPSHREDMPPHVLFLEPSQPLAPSLEEFTTSRDLADAATLNPGIRHQIKTPATLGDVLILPGGGYGQYESHCSAIRWQPFGHHDTLTLPQIPLLILNHYAACQIKDQLSNALRSLPVNGSSYREMFSNLRNFAAYHDQYIGERAEAEATLLAASEARDLSELWTYFVYGDGYYDFEKEFAWAGAKPDFAVKSMAEVIRDERRRADRSLEQALDHVTERVRILDSFLRDAALADASRANLAAADKSARLASSVNVLTWVILIFTVISVALSFVPQGVKEAPFQSILNQSGLHNE
jgi:hypothetical protein